MYSALRGLGCLTFTAMSAGAAFSWDPYEWESYGVKLLRHRYGVGLVPVPDGSGGDGGLDAYTKTGIGWQCYAPENEPLSPKKRFEAQRGKITTDLKKLVTNQERVKKLLGPVILTEWVLLTPKHESADLVAHCAAKSKEMREKELPFLSADFTVHVHDLTDFAAEHRLLQGALVLPGGLHKALKFPDADENGEPFENAKGGLIDVMDEKLKAVVPDDADRAVLRGEYLRAKVTGDDKLANFEDSMPDVAEQLREVIAAAKRRVRMEQAKGPFNVTHLGAVQADLESHLKGLIPELSLGAVEQLSQGAITQWLQECSMRFGSPAPPTVPVRSGGGDD